MPVVCGPTPLLCLLLLLLAPDSPDGGRLPQRRFEYKLSFKGPRLALPGAGMPFWSHHGDAILGLEEVRLAPSMPNRSGAVWSRAPVLFSGWEVEMKMRVTGLGRRGAQGVAVWYTQGRGEVGSVLGGLASGDGVGILFDSSAQDAQSSPAIRVLASDGHTHSELLREGASRVLGSCYRDFRNRPYPFRVRITYWGQRLHVSLNSGLTPNDPDEVCVEVGPLLLAPGGFFGVTAATTGCWGDDHDVLSFLTYSLREPGPEAAPQPFLEKEQLRLASQLEGMRAKLGLGTQEDMIPKLSSKDQEEGERIPDLEETLGRHSQILQALQGLSEQLAQAERQWKKQLGSPGKAGPEEGLMSPLPWFPFPTRDTAAHMASRAHVLYLPVGIEHHFSELAQILSLLQKDLRGLGKVAAKDTRPPGQPPGAFSCLQPYIFLVFLFIQTVGFFCYMHFSKQELDKSLQDYLRTGSLPLSPAPCTPRALRGLRRQPLSPSMHA
uniref:Lectin, mannose binding 1 like n=1 Tax=Rhinolophus ferrumequinum TaxID=59479 RepID=A0A671FH57_RHIFE